MFRIAKSDLPSIHYWWLSGASIVLAVYCVVSALHWRASTALWDFWINTQMYGFAMLLVPFVAAATVATLVMARGQKDSRCFTICVATILVGSALSVASILDILVAQTVLLPLLVWLSLAAYYGWRAVRRVSLAFMLLVFVVPVWESLTPYLQTMCILVTTFTVDFVGITAHVVGDTVYLREGQFVIEEGCAGLSFLLAGLTLGGIHAYLYFPTLQGMVFHILLAGVLAIVANWIRVLVVVLVGEFQGMEHELIRDHRIFGWIVFAVCISFLVLLTRAKNALFSDANSGTHIYGMDVPSFGQSVRAVLPSGRRIFKVVIALVAPPALVFFQVSSWGAANISPIELPDRIQHWSRIDNKREPISSVAFDDAAEQVLATYQFADAVVDVAVFRYDFRDRSREMIGYPNRWFDGSLDRLVEAERIKFPTGRRGQAQYLLLENNRGRHISIVGYIFKRQMTSSDIFGKFLALTSTFGRDFQSDAVAISMRCDSSCDEIKSTLLDFATSLLATT